MKNDELIASAAVEAGVYTDEEVKRIISSGGKLPLHTATAWGEYGKRVKSGEKPLFFVRLWRFRPSEHGNDTDSGFYASRSAIYGPEQVEEA